MVCCSFILSVPGAILGLSIATGMAAIVPDADKDQPRAGRTSLLSVSSVLSPLTHGLVLAGGILLWFGMIASLAANHYIMADENDGLEGYTSYDDYRPAKDGPLLPGNAEADAEAAYMPPDA